MFVFNSKICASLVLTLSTVLLISGCSSKPTKIPTQTLQLSPQAKLTLVDINLSPTSSYIKIRALDNYDLSRQIMDECLKPDPFALLVESKILTLKPSFKEFSTDNEVLVVPSIIENGCMFNVLKSKELPAFYDLNQDYIWSKEDL